MTKKIGHSTIMAFVVIGGPLFLLLANLSMVLYGGAYKFLLYGGEFSVIVGLISILFAPYSKVRKLILIALIVFGAFMTAFSPPLLARPAFCLYLRFHRAELETANQILLRQKGTVDLKWGSGMDNLTQEEKEKLYALRMIGVQEAMKNDERIFMKSIAG